jgi:hypothetical protein
MLPVFTFDPHMTDPATRDRIQTGRPATHLEILQRQQEIERLHWMAVADREGIAPARGKGLGERVRDIRQSLSRVLITAGQRIDPQAA